MKTFHTKALAVGLVALLGACENQQAGDLSSSSNFGDATVNNTLAQSAYLRGGVLADMSAQFRRNAPDMINFAFDSAQLDAQARANLDQQAAWIRANPAIRFRVYGHTDLVGSNAYNQRLGLRRAQTAVNYLVSRGVSRSKLEAVASYGETRPLVDTTNRERLNRRTVTEVVGFAAGYAGHDFDGKLANRIYTEYWQGGGEEVEAEEGGI